MMYHLLYVVNDGQHFINQLVNQAFCSSFVCCKQSLLNLTISSHQLANKLITKNHVGSHNNPPCLHIISRSLKSLS